MQFVARRGNDGMGEFPAILSDHGLWPSASDTSTVRKRGRSTNL